MTRTLHRRESELVVYLFYNSEEIEIGVKGISVYMATLLIMYL